MSKYDILESKLVSIKEYINTMQLFDESVNSYMMRYRHYLDELINATRNRTIRDSKGAVLGLVRGISDYDEICDDDILWKLLTEADSYYSKECVKF